jgi:hypothetical protein
MSGQLQASTASPRERDPDINLLGGSVDPEIGLDDVEKRKFFTLPGLEHRPLGHLTRIQSLYRLRYPGFPIYVHTHTHTHTNICI